MNNTSIAGPQVLHKTKMRPLPVLEKYCISPHHGFLDDRLPLTRLSSKKYMKWEEIVADLPSLLQEDNKVRSVIDGLDVLDLDETVLGDVRELRKSIFHFGVYGARLYLGQRNSPECITGVYCKATVGDSTYFGCATVSYVLLVGVMELQSDRRVQENGNRVFGLGKYFNDKHIYGNR